MLCLPRNLHDRQPRVHPVLLKALCTAPATKSALQVHKVLCLPGNLHSRFTKCCACHEICTAGSRGPAATTRPVLRLPRNLRSRFAECCACHKICTTGSRGPRQPRVHPVLVQTLCTAPATKSALHVHKVLCLPRNLRDRQPRPSGDQVLLKALCTASATKSALQLHQGLCLPRNLRFRFTKCCACHELCPPEGSVHCTWVV